MAIPNGAGIRPDERIGREAARGRIKQRARLLAAAVHGLSAAAPRLARIGPLRRRIVRALEAHMREDFEHDLRNGLRPRRVCEDRLAMGTAILRTLERALAQGRLSAAGVRKAVGILGADVMITKGHDPDKAAFLARNGHNPPGFLLVSPTRFCNLHCRGCYADSSAVREKLPFEVFDRMIREAHDFWGSRFFVLSGGEPLAYRDGGRGVLDAAERHPDCMFLMYTNGTLIDDDAAKRLGRLANVMPAVSVEGLREATERRRGPGVFERAVAAMERMRREKVVFGVSFTATRENADEVLTDSVIDFYFDRLGAMFAWLFHYMPMGRAYTVGLMPTPPQRLRMWRRFWELVRERHLFIADFWNGGTISKGCISAGRQGGYMVVDWNGAVMPCVFMPYSPVNIIDAYARGLTLNDVWADPFFARVRKWQKAYGYDKPLSEQPRPGNLIMPCPIRDHYAEFHAWLGQFPVRPADENAAAAALDPEYGNGMARYNREVAALLDPIWETEYLDLAAPAPEMVPEPANKLVH